MSDTSDSKFTKEQRGRQATLFEALFIIVFAATLILGAVKIWEADVHIPLLLSSVVAASIAMFVMKVRWMVIEDGIMNSILMGMQAMLILYTVGALIGSWIQSGVVPTMIYYGLKVIHPNIFLIAALLMCSVVSLATGTSWGTTGTIGIALMGIGAGLGIPPAMTAGFCISGAYFGDKMSPLSDTTNLAPAMAGTDLFQHIRAMVWTTGPTYIIVIVLAGLFGLRYAGGTLDTVKIEAIQSLMAAEFTISPWGLLPPLLVIGLAASQKPAIPSIFSGVLAGAFLTLFREAQFTDITSVKNVFGSILNALQNGYTPALSGSIVEAGENLTAVAKILKESGVVGVSPEAAQNAAGILNELLARGGLQSMNWTISLIICALTFGGILDRCGFLEVLLSTMLKGVKSATGLVTSVILACFVTNALTGDQYISLVLPGRMFKSMFEKAGLHPRMLSRSLEDSGTLTSVLIPWNTCGAYQSTTLGVPTVEYLPYAFLNYLNPLIAIAMTFFGIGIAWRGPNGEPIIQAKKPDNI